MTRPIIPELQKQIQDLPLILQEPVGVWFENLADKRPEALELGSSSLVMLPQLTKVVACSEWAGRILQREWSWFCERLQGNSFSRPPSFGGFKELAVEDPQQFQSIPFFKRQLRRYRNRQMFHILWRQLVEGASPNEALASLSSLADEVIIASIKFATELMAARFGEPQAGSDQSPGLLVIGMGKLGGRELNFSSDVDLIFLHQASTETDGPRKISANEFYIRVAREVVGLLDEITEDGFVFRVDTRLRPFGDSGPPVTSFGALELYLQQHGRSWERYAYVKARVIATPGSAVASRELQEQVIRPFVYRRYLDYGVFESLREMKAMISAEVQRRELADNIKLGPGGIREIEFIAQSIQLVRGGSDSRLREQQLQSALPLLVRAHALTDDAVNELLCAYQFLRRLENFIQGIRDAQSHDLPANLADRARLALAMGYADWEALANAVASHRDIVSRHFAAVVFRNDVGGDGDEAAALLAARWNSGGTAEEWQELLQRSGLSSATELARIMVDFGNSIPGQQIDAEARRRLAQFIPILLINLQHSRKPEIALGRVLRIIGNVVRRSAYIALLNENPPALERLVNLCDSGAYLADTIARYPLLLDELLDPRLYSSSLTREDIRLEVAQRLSWQGTADSEHQIEVLCQYQRATLFRIAVADISNQLPVMKVSDSLTDMAEVMLGEALRIAYRDLVAVHGEPGMETADGYRTAGFGVVAYGKFAGLELSYKSDLDLVFLHDSRGQNQLTNGDKPLDNSMFFARLARRIVHVLTTQTGSGNLYEIDMRLRPSGHSGLMVTSVEAFERYQEENAWTWEHQALLRSRPVAGSAPIAREFERVRADTLRYRVALDRLKDDVRTMRQRMRKELDKSDPRKFDLKQGRGGIGDIEFIVQYLALRDARAHPAVIHYPDNIRQLGTLSAAGSLNPATARELQQIYQQYRLRLHRLALNELPPFVASVEFVDDRHVVSQVWDSLFS